MLSFQHAKTTSYAYLYVVNQAEIIELIEQNYISKKQYESLSTDYEILRHELAELKRMIFGSKSEKFVPAIDGQLGLFEDAHDEDLQDLATEDIAFTRIKSTKDKKKPVRMELPAHLPRIEEVIEPENLPRGAKKIGEQIAEMLEMIPAKVYVRRIVRPKYVVEGKGIVCADMPTVPIPKSNAGPSILAHLIVSKFVDHLPFYRQSKIFKRDGLDLAESTISGWFTKSCDLLEPLYDKMKQELLTSGYIQADETPIKVLDPEKKKSTHRGYHWVYHDPVKGLVVFDYNKGRSREGPNLFLENFSGILQTDGYSVYNNLKIKHRIIHAGCMAHMRRKFFEAKDSDPKRAEHVLELIKGLYMMEQFSRESNHNDEEIRLQRNSALGILNRLKDWMDQEIMKVRPKSPIGKAIAYALNQWPKLLVYIEHPQMRIDNNLIENTIRPVALGRKNYLFAGSHEAAQRAAMIYSFLGTCKLNEVNPFEWLNHVLNVIPDHKASKLHELFPQNYILEKQV
jgi:transposase